MADTPAPGPQTPPDDDPFNLGDTGLSFTKEQIESVKPKPPQGPDGKFVSPKAVTPPAPAAPQHPAALVRQAVEFGMDEDLIAAMKTPDLYRTVNLFLSREREISKSFNLQNTLDTNRVPQPRPEVPPAPEPDPLEVLAADGFDKRLLDVVKSGRSAAEEVKALRTELQSERNQREQAAVIEKVNLLDAAFAKLADPRFGEGNAADLAKDPMKQVELKRRRAVLIDAGITDVRQVDRQTIMKILRTSRDQLFGAPAAVAEPAAPPENPYAAKPRVSAEDWNNGGVAKPSQRNGAPELKGDALAIKNLTERFREQDSQHTDDAELEGLPD